MSVGGLVLPPFLCALGELKLSPVVRPVGQPESYGTTQRRIYSRDPLRLGLKLPYWTDNGRATRLQAVVVRMADLQVVPDSPIQLSIESWQEPGWRVVQQCELGDSQGCDWTPNQDGRWRVVARAAGLPEVKRVIHVWGEESKVQAEAKLEGPASPVAAGIVARYPLRQPYQHARALLSVESNGLLHQQWFELGSTEQTLELNIQPQWAPCFHVAVLVLPVTARGQSLQPSLADSHKTCIAADQRQLIELSVAPPRSRPGGLVRVKVRSLHDQPLTLSMTAIDAAVLDLDPELRAARDPHAGSFLQRETAGEPARTYSLQAWASGAASEGGKLLDDSFYGGRVFRRGTRDISLGGSSEELDRIEVLGSRLSAADIFAPTATSKGQRPQHFPGGVAPLPERWRELLRTRFAESAFWLPAERLEAGQTREFEFKLPDNLTRWHVEALAADAADQFQLAHTAIEAGLAVEARALAPARVFVGDRLNLGAELRNAGTRARTVEATLELTGTQLQRSRTLSLAPSGAQRLGLPWSAQLAGSMGLLARVHDPADPDAADAMLRQIQVESRFAPWVQRQSGLLLEPVTRVDLGQLLARGLPAQLGLRLSRNPLFGLAGLFEQMRDYPHRCLEQRLSRALVASHARSLGELAQTDVSWASEAVVREALDNLASYRNGDDELVYFNPSYESVDAALMVYALLVFAELDQLDEVPAAVRERAIALARESISALADVESKKPRNGRADSAAFALRALSRLEVATPEEFQAVIAQAGALGPWGSSQLVQALAERETYSTERETALARLRSFGVRRGPRISLREDIESDPWLGSDHRDACELLAALVRADHHPEAHAEQSGWLYGILDAYGSALPNWDTQVMASCSGAAQAYAERWLRNADPVAASASLGSLQLLAGELGPQHPVLETERELGASERPGLQIDAPIDADLSFELSLTQQRDLLELPAANQGLALTRSAEVWRGQQWLPLSGKLRLGEWLRVRLLVEAAGQQSMVALSDTLPGGLRAIDKTLEGVSDPNVQQADEGSFWFFERQLSTTHARFYATELPGGRQEVIYYAQARHAGRYAWPGATVELMYALQRYGRSAAQVLEIE